MTTTPKRDAAADLAQTFTDYVPSLEGRDIVTIRPTYGLVIDGGERPAQDDATFPTIEPASGAHLADVAEASPADVDAAVAAARRAFEGTWRDMPGRRRAKLIFRLARLLQDRAREVAVLESIDGGKPIRESRDIDVPLSAAHLFYHAGWADKLEYAVPGMTARPARRGGADHPVELPAPDGRVEDRAGPRVRQHGGAEAGRDHARSRRCCWRSWSTRRASRRAW